MPSLNDISFISQDPIDKIVQQGEISIVNNGTTSPAYQTAKIVSSTVANDYGRAGFIRARWSIDGGTNWQGLESQILYVFNVATVSGNPGHPSNTNLSGLDSALSIGCSDSTITFRTANGKHGNVTNTVSPVYTPTSRTFLIQYTLMERE
jgi:hypothetical protein